MLLIRMCIDTVFNYQLRKLRSLFYSDCRNECYACPIGRFLNASHFAFCMDTYFTVRNISMILSLQM